MSKTLCDEHTWNEGETVAISAIRPMFAEAWCEWVKRETGVVVDWSYAGGRNVFVTLGDVDKVAPYVPMLEHMVRGEAEVLLARFKP